MGSSLDTDCPRSSFCFSQGAASSLLGGLSSFL